MLQPSTKSEKAPVLYDFGTTWLGFEFSTSSTQSGHSTIEAVEAVVTFGNLIICKKRKGKETRGDVQLFVAPFKTNTNKTTKHQDLRYTWCSYRSAKCTDSSSIESVLNYWSTMARIPIVFFFCAVISACSSVTTGADQLQKLDDNALTGNKLIIFYIDIHVYKIRFID